MRRRHKPAASKIDDNESLLTINMRKEIAKNLNDTRFNEDKTIKTLRNKLRDLENKRELANDNKDNQLKKELDEEIEFTAYKLSKEIEYKQQGGQDAEYKYQDPFGEYAERRHRRRNRQI